MGLNLRNKVQDNNNSSSTGSTSSSSCSSSSSCKLRKLEVTPIEETRQDTDTSSVTTTHSPNVTENVVSNDSTSTNIDSNLIVKASADGKIEDIISPVAITERKPFQKDISGDKNKTPSSATFSSPKGMESERSNKDRLSSSGSSSRNSVQNLIINKMSQTSLKRKQTPPPLGIQPSNKIQNKNQQQQQQNLKNRIQDRYRNININQNLKKPRVQYLGKVPLTKKYSKSSTIPYLRNKANNYSAYSMYPSQRLQGVPFPPPASAQPSSLQQQQYLFPNFPGNMAYPMSAIPPSQLPNFLSPPFTAPFPTSNSPYIASMPPCNPYSYYYQNYYQNIYPNSRAPINPDMMDSTLLLDSVPPYLQYDNNIDNNKHHHNNDNNDNNGEIIQSVGSEYSIGLRTGRSSVEFETNLGKNSAHDNRTSDSSVRKDENDNDNNDNDDDDDDDDNDDDDDDDDDDENNNIEESDLAIEEGAVPTPIFTRFQHDVALADNRNNITNNNNVISGEIKILDNRYSFEYLQRSDKDLNKKIFMSICNQIWNECHK